MSLIYLPEASYKDSDRSVSFKKYQEEVRKDFVKNKAKYLHEIKKRYGKSARILGINLVGSYANGNAKEDSDIDLGIWVHPKKRFSLRNMAHNLHNTVINKYAKGAFDIRVAELDKEFKDADEWTYSQELRMMHEPVKVRLRA